MKLNDGKTVLLIVGTPTQLINVNYCDINIGKISIYSIRKADNLGVLFDDPWRQKCDVNNI